jgi:CheY-like chemotaxis protein
MDGYETCRRIRQQPGGKNIVLLAVTGLGGNETVNRARLAGFDDVIIKPVKADDILRLTHRLSDDSHPISQSSSPMGFSNKTFRR